MMVTRAFHECPATSKKYDIPATLFINTKTVGGGDYMTWGELKDVVKHDIEIGNHTHSHAYFLNLPENFPI
jgi:peptidoglycan/xylan/chitin deacetylase (PgdA/CDA1 family)